MAAFRLISEQPGLSSILKQERGASHVLCFTCVMLRDLALSTAPIMYLEGVPDRTHGSGLISDALYFQPVDNDHRDQLINLFVHW